MKTIAIGKRVKFLADFIGITQGELARRVGMDYGQMSRLVNGQSNPTIATLERLEEVLGFDIIEVK